MGEPCTMVVIDDIKTVVNGIVHNLNWPEHGIEIVGTANDGESGLQLLQDTRPDIIVTDIRMPKLSGIEMTRNMMELLPHSKIIFISGYSDFDNARQAIEIGAFDYVLKPFTSKQLLQVVLKARDVIAKERDHHRRVSEMEHKLRESMPLLRQEYLNVLVRYASDPETAQNRWEFLGIDMDNGPYAVMVMEMDQHQQAGMTIWEIELNRFSVQNILEETIRSCTKGVVFRDGVSRYISIVSVDHEDQPVAIAEKCLDNVARFSKCTISVGVGSAVPDKVGIPKGYRQAMEALSYNFFTGGNSVFDYRNTQDRKHQPSPKYPADKEKELLYCIRSGNTEKTVHILEQIFMEWAYIENYPSPELVKVLYVELAMAIHKSLIGLIDETERSRCEEKIKELAYQSCTIKDAQQFIKELCLFSCGLIETEQREEAQKIIDQSVQYMRNHLHLNLSVGDYAKHVHLSPSYFANLFKKITGMSVMQFVLNERMERAKLLLIGSSSIQEAAEALGYEDRSYFSEVFKKQTGMTPKEFKLRYTVKVQGSGR